MKLFRERKTVVMIAVAAMLILFTSAYANDPVGTIVDNFTTSHQASVTTNVGLPVEDSNALLDGAVLGGERDLYVRKDSGGLGDRIRVSSNGTAEYLSISVDSGVTGIARVSWDGTDGDAVSLNATGLPNINLTTNPLYPFDGFNLLFLESDLAVTMDLEVYTDGTNWSRFSFTTPTGVALGITDPVPVFIPFASFSIQGGTGADFSNVGAIQLVLNATAAYDGIIDFIEVQSRDYGDLPASYGITLLADDGARHIIGPLVLGTNIDGESDGQEDPGAGSGATGGDDNNSVADETGVVMANTPWRSEGFNGVAGGAVTVSITDSSGGGGGCVSGWIDWNGNGDLTDPGTGLISGIIDAPDQIIDMQAVNEGFPVTFTFNVPDGTFDGTGGNRAFFARFRLVPDTDGDDDCSNESSVGLTGETYNGEVEDYLWEFTPTAVTLHSIQAGTSSSLLAISVVGFVMLGLVSFGIYRGRLVKKINRE